MDKHDQLFIQLLYIFQQSAMQSMGKIKNPLTDKVERNLDQAQNSIDLLEMLKEKTRNNIPPEASKILDGFLMELRLNYIDEVNKKQVPS